MPMTLKYKVLEFAFRAISAYIKDRVEGLENLPPRGEGYVAAANHRSFADSAILPQTLVTARNEPIHMVSYSELFDKPIISSILTWAEGLVLDRGSKAGIEKFFEDAKHVITVLHEGVGIHPEAHIQTRGKLGRGRPGAAKLAIETGCSVVPIALYGTDVVMPPGTTKLNFKRRALSFRAGKRIYFHRYRKAYDAGDDRAKKEILSGCTTIIMRAIGEMTGQTYHFGARGLEKLKQYEEPGAGDRADDK
ncbi:MAG: lysophospholipid acyltransferase family protein [Planctomycetota bacterium]|jgi:1-acyl-sn-glycerol-3-phosphate acyltransferase